ncbi:YjbQ family protein [Candidatus Microgenomates bacterium]|nr:MAG: YjbQ family protein [Candidatus Microgenomates bacterium]
MLQISINTTKHKQVLDITDIVAQKLTKLPTKNGICHVFALHTTCALTTADLDPGGTEEDYLDAIEKMFPRSNYRHPHDPSHVGDHIMSSLIGPSISIPFINGKLVLGTWQRIVLIELSGPRTRSLTLQVVPTSNI